MKTNITQYINFFTSKETNKFDDIKDNQIKNTYEIIKEALKQLMSEVNTSNHKDNQELENYLIKLDDIISEILINEKEIFDLKKAIENHKNGFYTKKEMNKKISEKEKAIKDYRNRSLEERINILNSIERIKKYHEKNNQKVFSNLGKTSYSHKVIHIVFEFIAILFFIFYHTCIAFFGKITFKSRLELVLIFAPSLLAMLYMVLRLQRISNIREKIEKRHSRLNHIIKTSYLLPLEKRNRMIESVLNECKKDFTEE